MYCNAFIYFKNTFFSRKSLLCGSCRSSQNRKKINLKRFPFIELIHRAKPSSRFPTKLKVLLVFTLVFSAFFGVLMLWAGIAAVRYVASLTQDKVVAADVEKLKSELQRVPAFLKVGCWDKATRLMSFEPWFENPVGENLKGLEGACLKSSEPDCSTAECDSTKGISTPPNKEK